MKRALAATLLTAGMLAAQDDIAALVERLGSDEPSARSAAYNELQRRRSPEVVPLLGKRLAAFPLAGQSLGVYLLQQYAIDDTRAVYHRLLDQPSTLLRAAAAAALYRAGEGDALAPLCAAVTAATGQELDLVLNRLFGIDAPPLVAAVRAKVREGTPASAIETALYQLLTMQKGRDDATARAAEALLASTDLTIQAAAAAYLVAAGNGQHAPVLAAALRQQPSLLPSLQRFLQRAAHLDPVVLDVLAERLAAAKSQYDIQVPARILQQHAPGKAIAALQQLLRSDDDTLRTAALEAISAIPGAMEPKLLREMLASGNGKAVLLAAEALRRIDDTSGFDAVLALVRDQALRAEAVRVLGGFRRREAVPPLLDALADADAVVRRNGWFALQNLLPDLFPYRRFDLNGCGYAPDAAPAARAAGLAVLRAWWAAQQ